MEKKSLRFFEEAELANALAREWDKYLIYIMKISAGLDGEINLLPSPYCEKSRPYLVA